MMEMTLGRMCLKAILDSLTPIALAAVTYSFSRATSTCPRTRRASPVHDSTPRMHMSRNILAFSLHGIWDMMEDRIMANGRKGIAANTSVTRISAISTLPPK